MPSMPLRLARPLQPMSSKIFVSYPSTAMYLWQLSILRQSSVCQSRGALNLNSKLREAPLGSFIGPRLGKIFRRHSCVHQWKSQVASKEGRSHPSVSAVASHDSVKNLQLPGLEEVEMPTSIWKKSRLNVRLRSKKKLITT